MADLTLPPIDDLSEGWSGTSSDYVDLARVWSASASADGDQGVANPVEIERNFRLTDNLDPGSGIKLLRVGSDPVAYAVARWMTHVGGPRVYRHLCHVHPDYRGRGIGTALLAWAQSYLEEIAAEHVYEPKVLNTGGSGPALEAFLDTHGYVAVEHFATLVRPNLDKIGPVILPAAVEIRPVLEKDMRAVYEAETEAFRDHWGFVEPTELDWKRFLEEEHSDPSLWKVAWASDAVVGQVRSFVNEAENVQYDRLRGWTEDISTHREYRGQGIARALINASLLELRGRGFIEAALGVHVENPHGAFRLYEGLGYRIVYREAVYNKTFD